MPVAPSSNTSLLSEAEKLKASLILSPSSTKDHCHNLALLVAYPNVMLELSFRKLFPQMSHAQSVGLLNHPDFLAELDQMVNAETIQSWPFIMKRIVGRAIDGDLSAAQFVAKKLKLIDQAENPAGNLADELISRMTQAVRDGLEKGKAKEKVVDIQAEVK